MPWQNLKSRMAMSPPTRVIPKPSEKQGPLYLVSPTRGQRETKERDEGASRIKSSAKPEDESFAWSPEAMGRNATNHFIIVTVPKGVENTPTRKGLMKFRTESVEVQHGGACGGAGRDK